jgi:hypothetical protein
MHTPFSIRRNLRSIAGLIPKHIATRKVNLAAECSTITQIGTWLCPCTHTNAILLHPTTSPHPLGTLKCHVCARSWDESFKRLTTFTSPTHALDFKYPLFRAELRKTGPRNRVQILPVPLASVRNGMALGYICTNDGCGMTWRAHVSKSWLGMMMREVKVGWGWRSNRCACGSKAFDEGRYVVFEITATEAQGSGVAQGGQPRVVERVDSGVDSVRREKLAPAPPASSGSGRMYAVDPPSIPLILNPPVANRVPSPTPPATTPPLRIPSAIDRVTPYDQFASDPRAGFTSMYAAHPMAPGHLIYSPRCAGPEGCRCRW